MVSNPPDGMPRVTPYLYYENVADALDWLSRCFGFTEALRLDGPDGSVAHAEMRFLDGVIMLGCPGAEFRAPRHDDRRSGTTYIYVNDVDAHHAHATQEGATITSEPEDQSYGDRTYVAEDPEGHRWFFAQHVKDVEL